MSNKEQREPKMLLYRVDRNNSLERLEEAKLRVEGKGEKYMQNLFGEKLEKIVFVLVHLKNELSMKDYQGKPRRIDVLFFIK